MAAWPAIRLGQTQWPPPSLTSVSATDCHPFISCTGLSGRGLWGARQLVRGRSLWIGLSFIFQFALYIILKFCLSFNNSPSLESPVVTVALSDILISTGETTVMACSASGTPTPEIRWYKGNTFEVDGSKTPYQMIFFFTDQANHTVAFPLNGR